MRIAGPSFDLQASPGSSDISSKCVLCRACLDKEGASRIDDVSTPLKTAGGVGSDSVHFPNILHLQPKSG